MKRLFFASFVFSFVFLTACSGTTQTVTSTVKSQVTVTKTAVTTTVTSPITVTKTATLTVPATNVTVIPAVTPETFDPIILIGNGDQTTAPFTVTTKEWIIDYSGITDSGGFFVYPRGETSVYVESVLLPSVSSGTTYSYAGPGDYYVKVHNTGAWKITIRPGAR